MTLFSSKNTRFTIILCGLLCSSSIASGFTALLLQSKVDSATMAAAPEGDRGTKGTGSAG